jgi:hypothetical protein
MSADADTLKTNGAGLLQDAQGFVEHNPSKEQTKKQDKEEQWRFADAPIRFHNRDPKKGQQTMDYRESSPTSRSRSAEE